MLSEKNITTKLNLLYYLEVFGNESDVSQLIEFLDISKLTLKKYITEINEIATDYNIIVEGSRLNLKSDHRENGMILAKRIIADSVNIQLLTNIFYRPFTLIDLSERLFITKSTILYKVEQINDYFKMNNLEISIVYQECFKIIGDESLIRNFFKVMLLEIDYHPIYENNKIIFSEIRRYLKVYFPEITSWNETLKIDTYIYVALVRSSQGFYLYKTIEEIPHEIFIEIDYAYGKLSKKIPFIQFIQKKFNVSVDVLFFSNVAPLNILKQIRYIRNEAFYNKDIEKKVITLLQIYTEKNRISIDSKNWNGYVKLITSQLILMSPINQVILRDFEVHFFHLKKMENDKINFLYESISDLSLIPYNVESLYYEFIIYFLISINEIRKDFFLINPEKNLTILIYSSQNIIFSEVIEYIIKDRYDSKFSINIEHKNIFLDSYEIEDYDIVISDVYVDEFEGKYLFLPMTPDEKFWRTFELYIK